MGSLLKLLVSFATMVRLESVHPLQSGVLRLKHPSERRPGLPREPVWVFWPRFVWESLYKHVILAGVIARLFVAGFPSRAIPTRGPIWTGRSRRSAMTMMQRSTY